MTPSPVFVGIDVAKADFVVACRPTSASWTASNDGAGIAATVKRLQPLMPTLIVLESTGGYEEALAVALTMAGLPGVVVNPRQVRDFGKALGRLAKTDHLDARLLALFAERVGPTPPAHGSNGPATPLLPDHTPPAASRHAHGRDQPSAARTSGGAP